MTMPCSQGVLVMKSFKVLAAPFLSIVSIFSLCTQILAQVSEPTSEEQTFGMALHHSYESIYNGCNQNEPWLLFELYRDLSSGLHWYDTNSEFSLSLERFFKTGKIELPSGHPANQGDASAANCVSLHEGTFIGAFSARIHMISPPVKTPPSLTEAFTKFGLTERAMHDRIKMCAPHFDIAPYWFMASFGHKAALDAGIVMTLKNGDFPLPVSGNSSADALSCATFAVGMLAAGIGVQWSTFHVVEEMVLVDPHFTSAIFAQFNLKKIDALSKGATLEDAIDSAFKEINYDNRPQLMEKLFNFITAQ